MSLFECKIFSKEIGGNVSVNVILPLPESSDLFREIPNDYPTRGQKYQTLYLLHGGYGDYSDWQRYTRVETYAKDHMLAVVMPSADNSMYTNIPYAGNYYNYYTQELPHAMQSIFPLSAKQEDNFIAGLSMGGYGAFRAAFQNPEKYAAAVSLSGGLAPIAGMKTKNQDHVKNIAKHVYGDEMQYYDAEQCDIVSMAKTLSKSGKKIPLLYQACGTEDFIYEDNIKVRDELLALDLPLTWEEGPGIHHWDFWDTYLVKALNWLPLANSIVEELEV